MNRQQIDKRVCFSVDDHCAHALPILDRKKMLIESYANDLTLRTKKTVKQKLSDEATSTKKYTEEFGDQFSRKKSNEIKKRIIVSHKGRVSQDKIIQSFQPLKRQLQRLKFKLNHFKNSSSEESDPFYVAIKQITEYKQQPKIKQTIKINKKYSPKKGLKDKLKPISEISLKKYQQDFLLIEKINILQNEQRLQLKKYSTKEYGTQFSTNLDKYLTLSYSKNNQQEINQENTNQYKISMSIEQDNEGEIIGIKQNRLQLNQLIKADQFSLSQESQHQKNQPFIKFVKCIPIQLQKPIKDKLCQQAYQKNSKNQKRQTVVNFQAYKKKKAFNPPFQTYHYRDLLWKVNFSNRLIIETPYQYQHRLKVYIGKGNNSGLVRGLIKRRIWFAVTDKIQQANFVWTQLKNLQYFKLQPNGKIRAQINNDDTYPIKGILTQQDKLLFKKYMDMHSISQQRTDERFLGRGKFFKTDTMIKASQIRQIKMQNHLINNYVIGNKKALFHTMLSYYNEIKDQIFKYLPLTFHVKEGLEDQQYLRFLKVYFKRSKQGNNKKIKNVWIVKPGQNSNRGQGIQVCFNLEEIKAIVKKKQKHLDGTPKTFIVQSYLEQPLLYKKRKFDLRHYVMISSINGFVKGYWYQDGYVRTTSSEYNLKQNTGKIHLTNDAVQKLLPQYGKFEKGNKISYDELESYINKNHKVSFKQQIYPKMKKVATDAIRACSGTIDPNKKNNNFQIFGLDFMIDQQFNLWLIEINSNPCLELSCPLLGAIIPKMLENAFQLTIDAIFPPPIRYCPKGVHYFKNLEQQNKFQLVYDQRIEINYKCSIDVIDAKMLEQQDDVFEDDGDEWNADD